MLKKIMKRAHEIARSFEGDYQARLSLALRLAWKEQRSEKEVKKQLVIADWWLRKNPAQETIINEFDNIEVEKETEKACLLNDFSRQSNGVWVPKSACEWKVITLEDKVKAITGKEGIKVWLACKKYASRKLKENGESEHMAGMKKNPKMYEYMAEKLREDGYVL